MALVSVLISLPKAVDAQTVTLNFTLAGNASFLDNLTSEDVGTSETINGVSVTFAGVTGTSTPTSTPPFVNANVNGGLGVDSSFAVGDETESFDFDLEESVTISFGQTVTVTGFDLDTLGPTDTFQFGPITLTDDLTEGNVSDIITLSEPVVIPANTEIVIQAIAGDVGLRTITFELGTPALPILGDVNRDGNVDFLDISPFIGLLSNP